MLDARQVVRGVVAVGRRLVRPGGARNHAVLAIVGHGISIALRVARARCPAALVEEVARGTLLRVPLEIFAARVVV